MLAADCSLYDFLSALQVYDRGSFKIIPGFHPQIEGIKITILENQIILNNIFGKNNHLSIEEQEFFSKTFQEFGNYEDFLNSNLRNQMKEMSSNSSKLILGKENE